MARIGPSRRQSSQLTEQVSLSRNMNKDLESGMASLNSAAPPQVIFVIDKRWPQTDAFFEKSRAVVDGNCDDDLSIDSSVSLPFAVSHHCRWFSGHSQGMSSTDRLDCSPNKPLRYTDPPLICNIAQAGLSSTRQSIDLTPSMPNRARSQRNLDTKDNALPVAISGLSFSHEIMSSVARSA
jgi:hypothetical protein